MLLNKLRYHLNHYCFSIYSFLFYSFFFRRKKILTDFNERDSEARQTEHERDEG
jgi:hypothetical protein